MSRRLQDLRHCPVHPTYTDSCHDCWETEYRPERVTVRRLVEEREELRAMLRELVIDANRLCDRNLGGTYEEDCRRSLKKADDLIVKITKAQGEGV